MDDKSPRSYLASDGVHKIRNCSVILTNVLLHQHCEHMKQKPFNKSSPVESIIDVHEVYPKVLIKKLKLNEIGLNLSEEGRSSEMHFTIDSQPSEEWCSEMNVIDTIPENLSDTFNSQSGGESWHLCVSTTSEEASPIQKRSLKIVEFDIQFDKCVND